MTSKSSLASGKRFLVFAGLVLQNPYGSVDSLLDRANPTFGFTHQGPVLTVFRAERRSEPCEKWVKVVSEARPISQPATDFKAWEPFQPDERKEVETCDRFPCKVKFQKAETQAMAQVSPSERISKFSALVSERVQRYRKTQERKEYEFAGDPVDPWSVMEGMGLKTSLSRPSQPELWVRKVELAPGKVKAIRQVLDWRWAVATDQTRATTWLRDVYLDHFFDGWGEWTDAQCSADRKSVVVTQAITLELDLMKQTDFFSKLMRPKMVNATEENGRTYLDQAFQGLAEKVKASAN